MHSAFENHGLNCGLNQAVPIGGYIRKIIYSFYVTLKSGFKF